MKNILTIILAIITFAFAGLSSEAHAENRGKPGKVYWNIPTVEEMAERLRQGHQVCEGGPMIWTCFSFSRFMGELTISNVGRQERGIGANFNAFRVIRAKEDGFAMFDEQGRFLVNVADVAKAENAAARWTNGFAAVPAAFANGGLMALTQAVFNPCGGGQCGGGGAVAYAISGSEANAVLEAALGTPGGCGGPCVPAAPQQAPAPAAPAPAGPPAGIAPGKSNY